MAGKRECNRAVLVSVADFDFGVQLGKRPGAHQDAQKLHKTLMKRGFEVKIHTDLSSEEIYQLFLEESKKPVKDCFLAVLSSHGEEGCVFGSDGKPVRLATIFTCFDNEYMEKKTKLFLIQACRGEGLDGGVDVDSSDSPTDSSFSQALSVPVDSAVMYATSPGYVAFTKASGSIFLQTFCTLLDDEKHRNMELIRFMTRISHSIAFGFQAKGAFDGMKEMPCLLTRLTREVFPFAASGRDGGAAGVSATLA
ncbi:caspase-3 [Nothobranchius furzeri]|nr:caspase-3-like [Nothobranchius furzeri]